MPPDGPSFSFTAECLADASLAPWVDSVLFKNRCNRFPLYLKNAALRFEQHSGNGHRSPRPAALLRSRNFSGGIVVIIDATCDTAGITTRPVFYSIGIIRPYN
jgi:hypothetical protein